MISFKSFLAEKKFFSLTPDEERQAEEIAQKFVSTYNTHRKKRELSKFLKTRKKLKIGSISILSRDKNKIKDISVYITRLINKNTGGLYMDRNPVSHRPEIFISNKTMSGDSEDAIIILKHEIGHAVQQYKKVSPDYSRETSKKNFEPNSVYYTEPAELQIQEMDIMNMFNQMLNRIKLKGKKYYEYYIPIFKRAINSILKKDWTSVEKSLLPQPLYIRQHFLDTLSQHPKYMRAFKLRLYNYIQNIPNEFPE